MNKRCSVKKNKTIIRRLVELLIVVLMLIGIELPPSGIPVMAEKLDNMTLYVDNTDKENLENEFINTGDSSEELTESSPISTLKKDEISVYADRSYNAENFFGVEMPSTNSRYIAKGIFVDSNSNAKLLIQIENNSNIKDIENVFVNGIDMGIAAVEVIQGNSNVTVNLPENNRKVFSNANGFIVISIGKLTNLNESFTLKVKTKAGGWNIDDVTVTINIAYEISKTVNKASATIGDEVQYTVTVKNSSDIPLYGVNIIDTIPAGLVIKSVNGSTNIIINNNILTLENNITLAKDQIKTYTIIATVSKNAVAGEITNTATMGSNSIIPKSAQASVTIVTKNVIVKKTITGNIGEISRKFNFTANVDKNTIYNKTNTFDLAHNEEYTLKELPTDAVLTISETNANGYIVKVTINGVEQIAEEGKYKIELKNYDKTEIVVNNHKDVPIDTGITIDSLPYLIILFFVIIGGSLLLINKRKHENYN